MAVLCQAVVSALEGKDCREVMKSIAESSPIPQDRLSHIVAGMYRVLSEAIRIPTSSLKQEVSTAMMPPEIFHEGVLMEPLKILW